MSYQLMLLKYKGGFARYILFVLHRWVFINRI